MKSFIAVFLVCVILITVLLPDAVNSVFDLKTMTRILELMGNNPVPSLTGGYEFVSFGSGTIAVLYITSYPVRLVFYVCQQISMFVKYISNPESIPPVLDWPDFPDERPTPPDIDITIPIT